MTITGKCPHTGDTAACDCFSNYSVTLPTSPSPTSPSPTWRALRADTFDRHITELHPADFEVCRDLQCRAVVVEEVRRGLTSAEDVWPPIEERKT